MAKKVVAFSIEIDGKKQVLDLSKAFEILNKQLIEVNKQVNTLNKSVQGLNDKGLKDTEKQFKKTGTSAQMLGNFVKNTVEQFDKSSKAVRDAGNGFFIAEKAIKQTTQEVAENADSISVLIKRNKELKKVLEGAEIGAQTVEFKGQRVEVAKLTKEFSDNRKAIVTFRKELRTGTKDTDIQKGSIVDLRKRVSQLKAEYIQLTPAQQKFTLQGIKTRRELISLTKQLKRQEEQIGDFRRSVGNYEKALGRVGRAALKVFGIRGAFEGLRRVGQGLVELVQNGAETNKVFASIQKSGELLQNTLTTTGESFLSAFGPTISKVLQNISFVIDQVAQSFRSVANSGGIVGEIINGVVFTLENFPAIIGGVSNVFRSFFEITAAGWEDLKLNAESAFLGIKRRVLELANQDVQELTNRLDEINRQLAENARNATTFASAYNEGFEEVQRQQEAFNKLNEISLQQRKDLEEAEKVANEAREKRKNDEIQRLKDLENAREEFRQNEIDQSAARLELIKQLSNDIIDLEIQNEEDRTAASIDAENKRFNDITAARNANFQQFLDDITQQQAKAAALFGEGSAQLLQVEQETAEQLRQVQALNDQLSEEQEKQHQKNLQAIRDNAAAEELKRQKEAFDSIVIEQEDFYDEEEALLQEQLEKEIKADIEQKEKRKENAKALQDSTITATDTFFNGLSQILDIAAEADNARFEAAIQERQNTIDALNEELQTATGLQKKFLEQQIEQEKEAQEEINKQAEKARKEQAEAQKAISIVQAIIGTAVAVTQALSSSPPPASFILAAAAAAAGAVQIATIAAQKFRRGGIADTGGVLNGPSHENGGIPFSVGGRLGFEAEGGEAIINKRSTEMFKPLLSRINEAGGGVPFQTGGITGPPITAPTVATSNANSNFEATLNAFNAQTKAINDRIDRIQVINRVDNFNEINEIDNTLDAEATL